MVFCFRKDIRSMYLCYDETIVIDKLPAHVRNAIQTGCGTMSFDANKLKHQVGLKQFAKDFLRNFNEGFTLIPEIKPTQVNFWEYDAFVIHDSCTVPFILHKKKFNICCSGDLLPGKFLYQAYSDAIHASRWIIFVLTPEILKDPLFQYQLSLTLCNKGHQSIIFVLDKHCLRLIPNNQIFQYAIATCRKIYRA